MKDAGAYPLGYRADIEGLRAVAILLVVAAHARLPGFAGGFVGVDVFFVLSGYLITGLLLRQMSTGTFAFGDFYARRLRRLLPGLLLMLLVTAVLGYLLTAPDQQTAQAQAAAGAAVWLSNFVFAFGNLDYFGPDAETNLFLHTWSLGVEEQFYLAWPLLLVLAASARSRDARRLKLVLGGVFAISLALCIAWTRTRPLLAFYMMPTRAWQFALGALTFLATNKRDAGNQRGLYTAGWFGLVAIVAAAMSFDHNVPYPGIRALLPSVGAAAVLAAGAQRGDGVAHLLALRPLQAIGRVSYAWYLWHWPVLLLGAAIVDMTLPHRALLAALSLACGTASYYLVETPIRRESRLVARPALFIGAAVALMVAGGALAAYWRTAATQRMASPGMARFQQVRDDKPVIYGLHCDDWYFSAEVRLCTFGPENAVHTAVVMGDSVGLQWFPAYLDIFTQPGWRLLVATKSSCPMVDAPLFYERIGREYTECEHWRSKVVPFVANLKPDVVILGSADNTPYSQEQWTEGTARLLQILAPASGHVYLLRSTPVLPFDAPSCLEPRSGLYEAISARHLCKAPASEVHGEDVYRWITAAASRFGNASTLDLTDAICPGGICSAERDGMIVFRDSQHLSAAFAKSLAGALRAQIEMPPDAPETQPGAISSMPQSTP